MAKKKTESARETDSLPPIIAELGDETPGYKEWFAAHPEADVRTILNLALAKAGYPHE